MSVGFRKQIKPKQPVFFLSSCTGRKTAKTVWFVAAILAGGRTKCKNVESLVLDEYPKTCSHDTVCLVTSTYRSVK